MSTTRRGAAAALTGALVLTAGTATAAPVTTTLQSAGPLITGAVAGDAAGHQVEVGDLDGDGVGDLVVGAWHSDVGAEESGAVHVLYGPVTAGRSLASADVTYTSRAKGEYLGEGPIGVADLDGDGRQDLLIGAPGSFVQGQPASPGKIGETFVVYGGARRSGLLRVQDVADAVITGIQLEEWLGFGVSGVGDLDRDGFEDVAVGAPATAGYSGALYVFHGSRQRMRGAVSVTSASLTLVGGRPGGFLGYESEGGDLDGDGYSDLVVNGGGFLAPLPGVAHVLYGGPSRRTGVLPAAAADLTVLMSSRSGGIAGPRLVADRDVTGDGKADLVLGDPVPVAGAVHTYVFTGGARRTGVVQDTAADTVVTGGGSDVTVTDADGDGRYDLVASDATGAGAAHVFRGPLPRGAVARTDAVRTHTGRAGSEAGDALAAGDLTGDGREDVAVGAPAAGAGLVHVVVGR